MGYTEDISQALQKGKGKIVKQLVPEALEAGVPAEEILENGLMAGMNVVGEKFKNNEVFMPEVLLSARAMNAGAALLKPYLSVEGASGLGKACIGTVKGDQHDIGKNLVKMMLEGKGFEVIDLGVDVPAEAFVKAVREDGCRIVACSALLTTTIVGIEEVVKALESEGLRDQVKVIIGGAPVTQEFCDKIGADAYAADAATAADKAAELVAMLNG